MLRTRIILPDGRELFSGAQSQTAIQSVTITQCVNSSEELTLGSVCSNMLEVKFWNPEGMLGIHAGEEISVYKVDEVGTQYPVGRFTTEKPTRISANSTSITAFDRVSWLDRDLTNWLAGLAGWPYTLLTFAKKVCEACGLTLINEEIPNGMYPVQAFSAQGITGRQLMQWIGQIAGRFCRATKEGNLEFAWYAPKETVISPFGDKAYFLNGLSYEDYQVAPIEKVHIHLTDTDVGAVYPDDENLENTYNISGNYLLTANDTQSLQEVAKVIYENLQGVSYTPCKVSMAARCDVHAGDVIQVTDRNGKTFPVYVMRKTQTGQKDILECTGSYRRDSSTAVNNSRYAAVSGKVLELQKNIEGLRLENREAQGNLTNLSLDVDGLRVENKKTQGDLAKLSVSAEEIAAEVATQASEMERVQAQMTRVQQTMQDVSIQVQAVQENGTDKVVTQTGYVFDTGGLKISKSGDEMENVLDNTGMYVKRDGNVMLQANNQGVKATNLHATTYLIIGSGSGRSRIEDYGTNRMGCFWVGG